MPERDDAPAARDRAGRENGDENLSVARTEDTRGPECVLAGLEVLKAALFCPLHGRWHGAYGLRCERIELSVERHGKQTGIR